MASFERVSFLMCEFFWASTFLSSPQFYLFYGLKYWLIDHFFLFLLRVLLLFVLPFLLLKIGWFFNLVCVTDIRFGYFC